MPRTSGPVEPPRVEARLLGPCSTRASTMETRAPRDAPTRGSGGRACPRLTPLRAVLLRGTSSSASLSALFSAIVASSSAASRAPNEDPSQPRNASVASAAVWKRSERERASSLHRGTFNSSFGLGSVVAQAERRKGVREHGMRLAHAIGHERDAKRTPSAVGRAPQGQRVESGNLPFAGAGYPGTWSHEHAGASPGAAPHARGVCAVR